MKMMLRTIALAAAATLIGAAGLLAQGVPQPAPSLASSGSSTAPPISSVNVQVRPQRRGDLERLSALGMMTRVGPQSGAGPVLVVPAAEISMDDLAGVTEDMTVMGRILQTTLGQAHQDPYDVYRAPDPFRAMFRGQGGQNTQSIYLQGFGALFMMTVDFPLSPGPEAAEEAPEEQAETDVDPVWRDTQRQIFEPERSDPRGRKTEEGEKYSAEKVENLKTSLITALKHATNIRGLAPGEVVVVTVTGMAVPSKIESVRTVPGTNQVVVVDSGGRTRVYEGGLPEDIGTSAPTVLTIRAKASDISSYAKGDSKLEQFREKVKIITCPQLGGAGGRTVTTSTSTGYSGR